MATGPGVNQGKTAFVEGFLPGNKDADLTAVNEAWTASGNEGTVSESLVNKVRSRLKLSKSRKAKGGAGGAKGVSKAKSKSSPKGKSPKQAKAAIVEPTPQEVKVSDSAKGPNKTAFIKDVLGRDRTLDAKAIKRAWAEAGHEGSISDNLFYKTKADMGIKGRRGRPVSAPGPGSGSASQAAVTPSNGHHAAVRTGPSADGRRDRVFVEIEAEIDELIYRVRELGGLDEVQEALRAARRILVRSHGA